jgi:hypothetical protein
MAYKGPVNRLFIDTALTSYTLTNEEIKNDPIVNFNSTTERTVTLNFPSTFDGGHVVDAYQGFDQGLGDIVVDAPFQTTTLDTFEKPDFVGLVTLPNSKVRIVELENTLCAYAIVDPSLFIDGTSAEITSYKSRYRLRIYNTGTSSLEFGLDDIPIESGLSNIGRYSLVPSQEQYVPKSDDAYVFQNISWGSTGGSAPEGGSITGNWTRVSNNGKTVDITDNVNGAFTFTLFKNARVTFV